MGISNQKLKSIIEEKFSELEGAINSVEKELMKSPEDVEIAKISFHFGRLQELYTEIRYFLKSQGNS